MKPNVAQESLITADFLRDIMDYNPLTGSFIQRKTRGGFEAGRILGFRRSDGYVQIKVNGRAFLAHRLAWLWCHGEWPLADKDIDHINNDRSDNRIENLRLATRTQNCANGKTRRTNKSGHPGVFYLVRKDGRSPRWEASIAVAGKRRRLGFFKDKEAAIAARELAMRETFGEFARAK